MAPIPLRELADRFLAQYDRAPKTIKCARGRLVRPLDAFGDAQAGDLTTERLQGFLARLPTEKVGKAYKRDIVRTVRMVYAFGVGAGLVRDDPAKRLKAPKPIRGGTFPIEHTNDKMAISGPAITFSVAATAPGASRRTRR